MNLFVLVPRHRNYRPIRYVSSIITNHIVEKTPITAQLWNLRRAEKEKELSRLHDNNSNNINGNNSSTTSKPLLSKTSAQSRLTLQYNFDQDIGLRDLYVDHSGHVSSGKLLEDLDAMAGNIAHTHCDDHDPITPPLSLVTASADNIRLSQPISIHDRLLLSGQVVWVGSSSLDIVVEVHRQCPAESTEETKDTRNVEMCSMLDPHSSTRVLSSLFTYVARDKVTGKAQKVNRLITNGHAEADIFAARESIVNARKQLKNSNSSYNAPTSVANNISGLLVNGLDSSCPHTVETLVTSGIALRDMCSLHASRGAVLMQSTSLQNAFICQPQKVNTSGKVFGGFLMHKAFDLAASTGYLFSGTVPIFKEVDKIHFRKPVEVGNMICLKSRVVYSSGPRLSTDSKPPIVMVEVVCNIINPEKGIAVTSNTFHFEFEFPNSSSIMTVLPTTAEEARIMISAARAIHSSGYSQC